MNTKQRVNWVDGMLINKKHFKSMEDYLLSNIYRSNRIILANGYGILNNGISGYSDYPFIKLSIDASDSRNQKIIIEQIDFMAVTPDGTFVDITANSFPTNGKNRKGTGSIIIVDVEEQKITHADPLYLILLTQPYETEGYGNSSEPEEPLRMQFCSSVSELKCVSSNSSDENIVGINHFPIAKIKIINHRLEIDQNFIPPCITITSHYKLFNKSVNIIDGLSQLSNKLDAMLQSKNQDSGRNLSYLKDILLFLYLKIIDITEYSRIEKENLKPIEIIRSVKILALQLKKALLLNSDAYAYYTEVWNTRFGINFHSFSKEIDKLDEFKYYDINEYLDTCLRIINDYLIKIAEISDYNASGYKISQPTEPDSDIIL